MGARFFCKMLSDFKPSCVTLVEYQNTNMNRGVRRVRGEEMSWISSANSAHSAVKTLRSQLGMRTMSLRNLAVVLTIVCGCALVLLGQEAKPGRKFALIIGVDQYEDSKRLQNLKYAEADAKSLAEALKGGFDVTLLLGEDASKAKIEAAFQAILKKGTGKDTLLVAFSGHGQQFKPPGGKEFEPFLCTRECKKCVESMALDATHDRNAG